MATPPRQRCPLDQVGLGPWVTRSVLGMAKSHQEISALRVGSVQRLSRIQRDLVVLRRLRRSEMLEGVIASSDRPLECIFGQSGTCAMPRQLQNHIGMDRLAIFRQGTHDPFVHAGSTRRADL